MNVNDLRFSLSPRYGGPSQQRQAVGDLIRAMQEEIAELRSDAIAREKSDRECDVIRANTLRHFMEPFREDFDDPEDYARAMQQWNEEFPFMEEPS